VLGTGTDVGKTYVTACLARTLRVHRSVLALKPIESGAAAGVPGDAGRIAEAAGHSPVFSPWRFPSPVSPHLAARECGVTLDIARASEWVAQQEAHATPAISLVELAGGVFSPLGLGITNEDLARALEPAVWILVAPDALGVLHDVTASLRAMQRAPDALVLSGAREADPSTGRNAAELSRLGIAEVLEVISAGATNCNATAEWLLRHPLHKSGP
jgi:dethiobiotin synthetase